MLTENLIVELEKIFNEGYVMTGASGEKMKTYWKKPDDSKNLTARLSKIQRQYAMMNIKADEKKRQMMIAKQKAAKASGVSPKEKSAISLALKRVQKLQPTSKPSEPGRVIPFRARKAA